LLKALKTLISLSRYFGEISVLLNFRNFRLRRCCGYFFGFMSCCSSFGNCWVWEFNGVIVRLLCCGTIGTNKFATVMLTMITWLAIASYIDIDGFFTW